MPKNQQAYSVEEATGMLKVDKTTLLVLLAAVRPNFSLDKVGKIRTRELERIYGMLKRP